MFDENILVQDIDADHWTRLLGLFADKNPVRPSILFLIIEQNRCIKAIHSEKGAIRNFDYAGGDLAGLAHREQVEYVTRVERDFFQQAFAKGQAGVQYDADYALQMVTLFNETTAYTAEHMEWYPDRPKHWKPLNYEKMQKIFNRILPDRRTAFFCVLDNNQIHTSLILGKRSGDLSLMTTLDTLDRATGTFDIEHDLPEVLDEIAAKYEKVHISLVIEKRCFEEMLAGDRPITYLCAAIEHGRALIHPVSWKLRFVFWVARVFKNL
jgi:hypothetical protein